MDWPHPLLLPHRPPDKNKPGFIARSPIAELSAQLCQNRIAIGNAGLCTPDGAGQ